MLSFLKWAGGKRWLTPLIKDRLPEYKTYYEPFVGSGCLFFALEPPKSVLSDTNPDLINCYKQVKRHCDTVIKILKRLQVDKDTYYKIRDHSYSKADYIKRAAYFIYLNKTCWNGLYRVNNKGNFNVPSGNLTKDKLVYQEEHLRQASRLLKNSKIVCADFEDVVKDAQKEDLVYFDPPYVTSHLKNGFIKYNSKLFSQIDELRLSKYAASLSNRGAYVIVSNAAHPMIKELYDGQFYKNEISRFSGIAADPARRESFLELLVTNFQIYIENGVSN